MKAKQQFILSFWFLALLWGAMGTAWAYTTSATNNLVHYSEQSVKNNQLGVQFYLDGVEDVVPQQEKINLEQLSIFVTPKHDHRPPSITISNYNFTRFAHICNLRDILATQIYPSHFYW